MKRKGKKEKEKENMHLSVPKSEVELLAVKGLEHSYFLAAYRRKCDRSLEEEIRRL
jgi:hypothetical protein